MRKIITSTLFSLVCCILYSQETSYGIKAGLNISNIDLNVKNATTEGRTGAYVGVLIDFKTNTRFHIQPEMIISSEGIKDGRITYLNFPVMLKYYFVEKAYFTAGPKLGILIDAKGGKEGLESKNIAADVGVGFDIPGNVFLDMRYSFGITNILDENVSIPVNGINVSGIEARTRVLLIGIGYKF